jgi:hypothetical protein
MKSVELLCTCLLRGFINVVSEVAQGQDNFLNSILNELNHTYMEPVFNEAWIRKRVSLVRISEMMKSDDEFEKLANF